MERPDYRQDDPNILFDKEIHAFKPTIGYVTLETYAQPLYTWNPNKKYLYDFYNGVNSYEVGHLSVDAPYPCYVPDYHGYYGVINCPPGDENVKKYHNP